MLTLRRFLAGTVLLSLGACAGALDGLRPVFAVVEGGQTGSSDAAMDRAKQHFAESRYAQAALFFRAAAAANPAAVDALNGAAASYDRLGRYDVAERYYQQALGLAPHEPQTLNNIGYSYYLRGKFDLAVAFLGEAAARDPVDAVIAANRRRAELALALATYPPGAGQVQAPPPRSLLPREERETRIGPPLPASVVDPAARPDATPILIANGVGRKGMAARLRAHLKAHGVAVKGLVDARRFGAPNTTISFRPAWRRQAEALARLLPVTVHLRETARARAGVYLEIGADLVAFDKQLLQSRLKKVSREVSA